MLAGRTKAYSISAAVYLVLYSSAGLADSAGTQESGSFTADVEVIPAAGVDSTNINPSLALNDGAPITPGETASGEVELKILGLGPIEISYSQELTEHPSGADSGDGSSTELNLPDDKTEWVKVYETRTDEIKAETQEDAEAGRYQWHVTVTAAYDW
ncbi:hypothetical protein LRD18_01010 [Halorhodospira halochloris]|uniref:hypothetical protein n=1 Tax=Halorhodospira halochloris TaxID=1052 RepID=UPI001EE8C171|nr:hypothetical protein [Halorhodospira halochloris]MCG5529451.1 hypothetical protein [Halorhodospira halochloris]